MYFSVLVTWEMFKHFWLDVFYETVKQLKLYHRLWRRHAWRVSAPFYPVLGCGIYSVVIWMNIIGYVVGGSGIDFFMIFALVIVAWPHMAKEMVGSYPTDALKNRWLWFLYKPSRHKLWYYKLREDIAFERSRLLALYPMRSKQ